MKETDIMIGDLVKQKNSDYIIKVTAIKNGYIEGLEPDKEGQFSLDDVEPIDITRENLKKNDWIVDMYSRLYIDENKWFEYYHFENRLCLYWKGVDEWENHAEVKELLFKCQCRTVNKLQHAFRQCGYDELADKFEV